MNDNERLFQKLKKMYPQMTEYGYDDKGYFIIAGDKRSHILGGIVFEMSALQSRNNQSRKKSSSKSASTTLSMQVLLPLLLSIALITIGTAEAKSKFKIEVDICCASSDSGTVKIKVKLPDGSSTSKKANLAKLAEAQDWDNVAVFIKLKHRYESFEVCISGHGCEWGEVSQPVQFKGFN